MVEDFTGLLRKFLDTNSAKLKYYRTKAQGLLEREIYLKKNSYFERLKLDIQLFHMEATTTSLFTVRKAFLLFMAVPSALLWQYYVIMQVFYKVFVFDVGVVKRKKILPLNFPADEDITYWPMWRVFVEHYLFSFDFWILFIITSFIVYGIVIATVSTNFLWSSDPDTQEKNTDKKDFSHMALQVSLKSKGDIAYVYEFKRIEMFLKAEVFLHLLSLDVHAFLGTKSPEQINKEVDLIFRNLESYLEQVVHMLLQIREYDLLNLKDSSNIAKKKRISAIKQLYNHIYDFETSENVAKVYEALYTYWLLDDVAGIVSYFEFEHILCRKAPEVKKKVGRMHPFFGYRLKFSEKQANLRSEKNLPMKTILWRRHKWLLQNFREEHSLTDLESIKKVKEFFSEVPYSENQDLIDYTVEFLHKNASNDQQNHYKNNIYTKSTVWNSMIRYFSVQSWDFKFWRLKKKYIKLFKDLKELWKVIYDKYLKKIFEKRDKDK